MKLIHGTSIKSSLREISPISIAVAYVGIDWASYVDPTALREIVLSPTIGTNPFAVIQLARKLGWDNVHFLDNLHSKIYLGATHAAVGSFNLTTNGLSAEVLDEAGFLVSEPQTITELHGLLENYKTKAANAYPTLESKLECLAKLRETWDRAVKTGAIRNDSQSHDILDYVPAAEDEAYACCVWGEIKYNEEVVSESTIRDSVSFDEADEIKPDRWILCWYVDSDGYLDDSQRPYWLHIDEVLSGGANDERYTKLAIERSDRHPLHPPFELSDATVGALDAVLRTDRFPEFLANRDPWLLNDTLPRLSEFFAAIQEEVRRGLDKGKAQPPAAPLSTDALRQLFQFRIREAMDAAVQKGVIGYTIQGMLQSRHAVEVAKKLVISPELQPGLHHLARARALDLSFEHIMQEPQFAPLFTRGELEAAAWRLSQVKQA